MLVRFAAILQIALKMLLIMLALWLECVWGWSCEEMGSFVLEWM